MLECAPACPFNGYWTLPNFLLSYLHSVSNSQAAIFPQSYAELPELRRSDAEHWNEIGSSYKKKSDISLDMGNTDRATDPVRQQADGMTPWVGF